jgi:signal transduction histidine kinase
VKLFGVRSVTVQLIILFAAILTLSQIASVGLRYVNRSQTLAALEGVRIAERIAAITDLMDSTSAEERRALAEHFAGSSIHVDWGPGSWVAAGETDGTETELFRGILAATFPAFATRELRVSYRPSFDDSDALPERPPSTAPWRDLHGPLPDLIDEVVAELIGGPSFLVSIRLADGSWLNVVAPFAESLPFWSLEAIAIVSSMVIVIVALSIWAIRRLTSPFQNFAAAAVRLGTDVNAPPLVEQGPSEVRLAIGAFNEMQSRIRRYLEDRTQMLAAISHDLRTPITRARLRAEFIDDLTEREKILIDFDEMENMVASVLDFAKGDASAEPTTSTDLVAMLQRICDDMTDRGHIVSFNTEGRLPYNCRPQMLRRCFTNLIDNAIKYGHSAEVDLESRADEIRVTIADRGPGIPADMTEQAFRPFFRLDASRRRDIGGSGLGLTVARTVARAHGGEVVLDNPDEGGLRVCVCLPWIRASSVE